MSLTIAFVVHHFTKTSLYSNIDYSSDKCYILLHNDCKGSFIMAQVNIRIDDSLKKEGDILFKALGISFSAAVSMFISQAAREQGLPFQATVRKLKSISIASEDALSKEWLSPEEDLAWTNL